jgi:hypothetical protein
MKAKWTGGVAQVVEYLLCNLEAVSSNPWPTKKSLLFKKVTWVFLGGLYPDILSLQEIALVAAMGHSHLTVFLTFHHEECLLIGFQWLKEG